MGEPDEMGGVSAGKAAIRKYDVLLGAILVAFWIVCMLAFLVVFALSAFFGEGPEWPWVWTPWNFLWAGIAGTMLFVVLMTKAILSDKQFTPSVPE